MKIPVNTLSFSDRYAKHVMEVGVCNDELFKVLNHTLDFLQAKTVSQYAQEKNTTVQNVYQNKRTKTLLGRRVVFDNY